MQEKSMWDWSGKLFHNELVSMTDSERKRIVYLFIDKTKKTALKECMVPGSHEGKIAEGHAIQEAVMHRITKNSVVWAFAVHPISDQRAFPEEIGIRHATTGYFTCLKHEALFRPVETSVPDFDNEQHKLLLAYKALLKVTWRNKLLRLAWEATAEEDSKSDMPKFMARQHYQMEEGIRFYKEIVETMLGIAKGSNKNQLPDRIVHEVYRIPSESAAVAASCWSNGLGWRVFPPKDDRLVIERIPQWGCTVYPLQKEHIIIHHYPMKDYKLIRTQTHHLRKSTGTVLQRKMSQDLLKHFEDMVIIKEIWGSFTDEKRQTITAYFEAIGGSIGIHSWEAPVAEIPRGKKLRLVNLFNGIVKE